MKTFASFSVKKTVAVAALVSLCAAAHASDKPSAQTNAPAVPKSVFIDNPQSGKDPFFPNSNRRSQTIVRVATTNRAPQVSGVLEKLTLKGISGTKGQPLALINSSTVAQGELADIKCGREIFKILCIEIRDRSVLVALHGTSETRELKLREGI